MSKWGKNYSKPTKSFKKAYLINKFRTELFTTLGLPVPITITSKYEGRWPIKEDGYYLIQNQLEKDIKEMKKIALQYASRLSRKDKKRFFKRIWFLHNNRHT